MTSTEFTVGLGEGARVSSKVLKPPGGGSSDIFGIGNANNASIKAGSEKVIDTSTHSRVFGTSDPVSPPVKISTLHQSSIFENGNQAPPKQTRKVYVRRNPITGEEIEISLESENDKNVCDNEEVKVEESASAPSKPVQTSIRVRNPPGGKSSGIF